MWHRKSDSKTKGSSSVSSSVVPSFPLRTKSNSKINNATLARRSREPPQTMNVSAFLRSVIISAKEDKHDSDEENEEDDESTVTGAEEHRAKQGDAGEGTSDDDNLHELFAEMSAVDRMCDLLEQAQVSSDDDRERKIGKKALSASLPPNEGNKEKGPRGLGADFDAPEFPHTPALHECEGLKRECNCTTTDSASGHATPLSSSFCQRSEASGIVSLTPPSLLLHKSSAIIRRRVKTPVTREKKCSGVSSGDESVPSAANAHGNKKLRRESQRLKLRRSLSGRSLRKTSVDSLLTATLSLAHMRPRSSAKSVRLKRSRSATKELPETPRDHQEEAVLRRALSSARRRYLIPRVRRTQHYNLHVVLDLDETLVSARNGPILVRPYVGHLIQTLLDLRCEIILWTAGIPQYVVGIIAGLTMAVQGLSTAVGEQERPPWVHHLVQRNDRWYNEDTVCVKDLRLLGRPMDRLLIIENNPAAVQLQVSNAILVQDYSVENYNDRSLEIVSRIVTRAAKNIEPVSSSLAADPELLFLEFELAAEHSLNNKPIRPVEYGLRYVPPGTRQREHAGESPVAIIEK